MSKSDFVVTFPCGILGQVWYLIVLIPKLCRFLTFVINSGEIVNKLKSKGFLASSVPTNDFSTLYTTLPHNLIIKN